MLFRNRRLLVLLGIGLLIFVLVMWRVATRKEWHMFALDAQSGRVIWSVPLVDQPSVFGDPVVSNGRVFFEVSTLVSEDTFAWKFVALDATSGQPLWEFIPDPKLYKDVVTQRGSVYSGTALGTPVVTADSVYVDIISKGGIAPELVALDAATGALKWTVKPAWHRFVNQYPGVAPAGERVVIMQEDDSGVALQALDAQTGTFLWQTSLEHAGGDVKGGQQYNGRYLVANNRSVFLNTGDTTEAFDLDTGALQFRIDRYSNKQIEVAGATLYALMAESLTAFDAATGAEHWMYGGGCAGGFLVRFQADQESVYASCETGVWESGGKSGDVWLFAVAAEDGHERWRTRVIESAVVPPQMPAIGAESVFVIGGQGGQSPKNQVRALSTADGTERWRFPTRHSGLGSVATDGHSVFVTDVSPRWRNWLARLNPAWH